MADDVRDARKQYKDQDEKYDQILKDLQLLRVQHIGMLAAMALMGLLIWKAVGR